MTILSSCNIVSETAITASCSSSIDTEDIEKMDKEKIKKENETKIKPEMGMDIKNELCPLWEGEVIFKTEESSEEIRAPVQIFHKDDSKNGCRLFDWAPHGNLYLETYR